MYIHFTFIKSFPLFVPLDCMEIDVSSCESTEDELDDDDIRMPEKKRFKKEDINSKDYFTEVKRIILNNLDMTGLSPIHVLSFDAKYRKEMKGEYLSPNPAFDAWMCVIGKSRPQFDVLEFKKKNPSVTDQISEIRKILRVSLSTVQKDQKKKSFNFFLLTFLF